MTDTPTAPFAPTVLVACVQNAGRSQAAAALLKALAGDAVTVRSGGSRPAAEVHPAVATVLAERGLEVFGTPRAWTDDDVIEADVVVTMGCGDACPFYPGTRYEDWDVADPAGQPLERVREIVADIEARVRRLLVSIDVPARA
jgi:arsenate reductase